MKNAIRTALATFAVSGIPFLGFLTPGHAQAILGTGSAFAAPLYTKWAEQVKASTGIALNYQALGSGTGQKQVLGGLTDFGASDAPMDAKRLQEAGILQFPTAVGAIVVFVNLPKIGVDQLRLNGPVLADIYMGAITRWDDPRIATLNPDTPLPPTAIIPLHHGNASGTTYAFSTYLAKVSPAWKDRIGTGMTLEWPVGAGVVGSAGAAGSVPRQPGSIAYAEVSYVSSNRLTTVRLANKAGAYVAPSDETFAAGAASADWHAASNFAVDLTDAGGERSWPLLTPTFVLVPKNPDKAAKSATVLTFFGWVFDHGDAAARSIQYVPLPDNVKKAIRLTWN